MLFIFLGARMIYNYPSIEVQERNLFTEIENIWRGYRTCYSSNVDPADAYPFSLSDWHNNDPKVERVLSNLKEAFVSSGNRMNDTLRAIAEKYSYDYEETNPLEEFNNIKNYYFGEFFETLRLINACKWIEPKLKLGHESPFEHGVITFTVRNCSRSLTHQLVRHRVASYSQSSQRYISENPEELDFVIPKGIRDNEEASKIVNEYLNGLSECIKKLKELKVKNEDIRCIYPNAITTDIQVTMNFRELKHFIELRLSKHAQDEIRYVAFKLLCIVSSKIPFVWNTLKLDI